MTDGNRPWLALWGGIRLAALSLLCALCLTACGAGGSADGGQPAKDETNGFVVTPAKRAVAEGDLAYYAPEMRAIYERGALTVAMPAADRKPFFYRDADGVLAGSDVELAADMAAQLGVDVKFVRTAKSFDEVVNQVASGQADIAVSKLSATLPRAEKVLFSDPYLTLHQGILLNRLAMARLGSASEDPLALLRQAKVKIGVIAGTSYVGYASLMFAKAEIVRFATPQESMDAAIDGEVAAIYYDELQLKGLLADNPDRSIDLQLHIMTEQVDLIAMAIPPKNAPLLAWTNLYLRSNQARIQSLLINYGILPAKIAP
ncbi:ABC transporter substrate-binding protein [Paenibacillus glycinis]|uniref:Transporter substrate-binding domain-containing protein n=1 Tax=Paenibacillus glycinis TaxID=2697035 RepID=A0ABW9XRB5_9BACL|nr:ABC transporter substrate-binding protein [Paenibacillus glycinis]NBD25165.1 transporter substrate-binding domain-containing protein [Paenibacillus glycinis]